MLSFRLTDFNINLAKIQRFGRLGGFLLLGDILFLSWMVYLNVDDEWYSFRDSLTDQLDVSIEWV